MTNPYPKPRWDLENDVLRLEQMIILYEQEIEVLKTEREELLDQVTTLQRKLESVSYTQLTLPTNREE